MTNNKVKCFVFFNNHTKLDCKFKIHMLLLIVGKNMGGANYDK